MIEASMISTGLTDGLGRRITYLRFSITDRCDFRCNYCMGDGIRFSPKNELLTFEESVRLVSAFVSLGVTKVRITGGEPLVRADAVDLIAAVGRIPGLRELVLTTNGSQLARHAPALRAAGVSRINISLDSLHPERFRRLTKTGDLDQVLRGIEAAQAAGFERVKLNTVMLRGVNETELVDLTRFAVIRGLDISFIEHMPMGPLAGFGKNYMTSQEGLLRLRPHFQLAHSTETSGGPARYWRVADSPTRVGFIAPHTHNFCGDCNRVRVSCKGVLHPCLGHDDGIDLLPALRHPGSASVTHLIRTGLTRKPKGHDFDPGADKPAVMRFMSMTGG
jgi:cyclic pyranopterin phosphate synthase